MPNVLKIDSSARYEASKSRKLTSQIAEKVAAGGAVVARDVAQGVPLVDEPWTNAAYIPADDRSAEQKQALAASDELVAEIMAADVLVFGVPMYNFGIPAALKAWFDQICRKDVTFAYTQDGPKGLLEGKKAFIVLTSGGVPMGAPVDFASPHMKQLMTFIGIEDVTFVEADGLAGDESGVLAKAQQQIEAIAA
ncbi:MAG: NAD(P)H-dependent oxidoreductase [Pseudomonadota bacterium]